MSDYLSEEEQLAKLKSWWDEYGKGVVAALVLVVGGALGWRWYTGYQEDRLAEASDLYAEFLSSDGVARDTIAGTLDELYAGTSYQSLSLLHRADSAATEGDYELAAAHFESAVERAPEPVLADLARLRLARVLVQLEQPDDALDVLGQIRGDGYRAASLEQKGDIHLSRGERAEAHQAYVAAAEAATLNRNAERPILEMKITDTADANES